MTPAPMIPNAVTLVRAVAMVCRGMEMNHMSAIWRL